MSALAGLYFDGKSARGWPVELTSAKGLLHVQGSDINLSVALDQVKLSPRLGKTRRQIVFAGGPVCELDDHPLLDEWFSGALNRRWNLIARWEGHWGMILTSIVAVGALIAILSLWGFPWAAEKIAARVPQEWVNQLGRGTLAAMDQSLGRASELPPARQDQLRKQFVQLAHAADVKAQFEFRHWPRLGANALALPDGTIVMTDELVMLAADDRELIAVIAHELGHVHERHALQQVLASSAVASMVFVLTGDVSGLAGAVVAAPTVLLHLRHSRELESAADRFAFALMNKIDLEPQWFAAIIRKLETSHRGADDQRTNAGSDPPADNGWLSSHPASEERARHAEQFHAR